MTRTTYKKYKNGFGLYSIVHTQSISTEEIESHIVDRCSWASLKFEYPNSSTGDFDLVWKDMVIEGLNFALTRITHLPKVKIVLHDIEGHIMHSNNYSMIAAGILAGFKELEVNLTADDIENIYSFVGSAVGKDFNDVPNLDNLSINMYKQLKVQ